MKTIILTILLFILPLTGCASSARGTEYERVSARNGGVVSPFNGIVILTVPGDVRRGEMANLEIQGKPGVNYTATATYRVDSEKRTTYRTIAAPKSGIVIWNFKIDEHTNPGVYPIHISGGGQEINTSYRVLD